MGSEIEQTIFTDEELKQFLHNVQSETKHLMRFFKDKLLSSDNLHLGHEVEGWLTTKDLIPAPNASQFLAHVNHEYVVPEISLFNFEINSTPFCIGPGELQKSEQELFSLWKLCQTKANELDMEVLAIGSLPTIRDHMLSLDYISPQKRYWALNDRLMNLRRKVPMTLDIQGKDELYVEHYDVMTESAATSLQIHLEVEGEKSKEYYNASTLISPIMVALCANSPFLYGKQLWDETRIPIFEQSVMCCSFRDRHGQNVKRVGLGHQWIKRSVFELFLENLDGHSVLLPECQNTKVEDLFHLKLHNGTIWRWNRPLIGTDVNGNPHLRIEHRVPSAGPSMKDMMANTLFYYGLVQWVVRHHPNFEVNVPFETVIQNFYLAAKEGLKASITWIDGKTYNIQSLIVQQLLPAIVQELEESPFAKEEIEQYINHIIRPRCLSGQNGANWQKSFINVHGPYFHDMTKQYLKYQKNNIPVHEWTV